MKTRAPYHGDARGPKHPRASQPISNEAQKDNPSANGRRGNEPTFHGVADRERSHFVLELPGRMRRGIARWCHRLFDGPELFYSDVAHWAASRAPGAGPSPRSPPNLPGPDPDRAREARLGIPAFQFDDPALREGAADRFFGRQFGDNEAVGSSDVGYQLVNHFFQFRRRPPPPPANNTRSSLR